MAATNRVLGLISGGASCAMLAATVGLGRLMWDQLRGLESSAWLLEWSVNGLVGGIAADMVAGNWRRHPALGLATMAAVGVIYFVCRHLWLEGVAALMDPASSFGWSLGGVIALYALWTGVFWLGETEPRRGRQGEPAGGSE